MQDYMPSAFEPATRKGGKRGGGNSQAAAFTRLREGEDEVIDFLGDQVVSQITSAPKRRSKGASEGVKSVDGRMVFNESDGEEKKSAAGKRKRSSAKDGPESDEEEDVMKTDHYKDALTSETAFTRTRDGRIKFLKPNKRDAEKGERAEGRGSTTQPGVRWNAGGRKGAAGSQSAGPVIKDTMLGKQYKAKRAKGDVKRPGMADPHAYIPLNPKLLSGKG